MALAKGVKQLASPDVGFDEKAWPLEIELHAPYWRCGLSEKANIISRLIEFLQRIRAYFGVFHSRLDVLRSCANAEVIEPGSYPPHGRGAVLSSFSRTFR